MPSFDTPEPLSATVEFDIGTARIIASKRTDTVVEVLPADPAEDADVKAAQQTKVSCSNGRLLVKGPRKRSVFGRSGSITLTVELPAGSRLHGEAPMADFLCQGPLGDCDLKTSVGDVQVEQAAAVQLRTSLGTVGLDRATGDAQVAGSGRIDVGEVTGTATVKNANGETVIAEVGGDLRVTSSNGPITVGVAHGEVEAKSANGGIRIGVAHAGVEARTATGGIRVGEVARGTVALHTSAGDLDIGVRAATAAWLDLNSRFGSVQNLLDEAAGPEGADGTVEVRARTGVGDIVVRRA